MHHVASQALPTTKPTTSNAQRAMFALMAVRYKVEVGAAIKARRLELGLTQSQLAELVHVKETQTISRWERGLNLPSDLSAVATALETTLADLFAHVHAPDARAARRLNPDATPTRDDIETRIIVIARELQELLMLVRARPEPRPAEAAQVLVQGAEASAQAARGQGRSKGSRAADS